MQSELFFELHGWLLAAALGFARVAPVFFILPFMNSNVLSGMTRTAVSMLVAFALWPHDGKALLAVETGAIWPLMAREAFVGLLLGCLLAWPFWVLHALGCIIDNQRGATLSSSIDPANGVDTSELANLFHLFAAVLYLQNGGIQLMLETFRQSYQLCDPLGTCLPALSPLLHLLNKVISNAVVLASPVVATLLLTEIMLGLLSRFAQQMNAFSVAMTVKTGVALLIMLLYVDPVLPAAVAHLAIPSLPLWLGGQGR